MRNIVGQISAGTLGYIQGNVEGAKRAITAYRSSPIMKRKEAPTNTSSIVKKAKTTHAKKNTKKRKITGKAMKGKRITGKNKMIKQIARTEALKVVHGEVPSGKYMKSMIANLPVVQGSPALPLQNVVSRLLWGNTNGYTDLQMSTGNYLKVSDGVSVLFGDKSAGFYGGGTGSYLSPVGMVIPNFKHIATYSFTNNTPVIQCLLFYETTPKEDHNTQDVASYWAASTNAQAGGTVRGSTYFGNRPEFSSQWRDAFKILKKRQVEIRPGESVDYTIQSNATHLKLDDWLPVGATTPTQYRKGFTKELMVIQWNKPVYGTPTGADTWMAGTWNVPNNNFVGIGVEVKERYYMRCPENVDSTKNDDNIFCVWSQYAQDLIVSGTNTFVTPAISQPSIAQ